MEQIFERFWKVIVKPAEAWAEIAERPNSVLALVAVFILPLVGLATYLELDGFKSLSEQTGIGWEYIAVVSALSTLISIFLGAWLIHLLAPRYKSESSFIAVFNLIAYSFLPVMLSKVVASLHPRLALLIWTGLYALALFWKGCTILLKTPENRATAYTLVALMLVAGIGFVINAVALAVLESM